MAPGDDATKVGSGVVFRQARFDSVSSYQVLSCTEGLIFVLELFYVTSAFYLGMSPGGEPVTI